MYHRHLAHLAITSANTHTHTLFTELISRIYWYRYRDRNTVWHGCTFLSAVLRTASHAQAFIHEHNALTHSLNQITYRLAYQH